MTTEELIDQALQTLKPGIDFHGPSQQQVEHADVLAKVATASALNRIADALDRIASNTAL